jgi:hypothetical protein
MITNFIIFGANVPNWLVWTIGGLFLIGIIALIVVVIFIFSSAKEHEETEEIQAQNEAKKEKERQSGYYPCDGSYFVYDTDFFSIISPKLKVTWKRHDKTSSDLLLLSSSWPIGMSEKELENFKDLLPELVSVKAIGEHQLSFKKSPAASFDSNKAIILKYLFHHLNNKYAWLDRDTSVLLEVYRSDKRQNEMLCMLKYKLAEHLSLGVMLGNIDGVIYKDGIMRQMRCNTNCFDIEKDEEKTWDELIPLIKEVFVNYFPKGVEFVGDYPSVETKSPSEEKIEEEVNSEEE